MAKRKGATRREAAENAFTLRRGLLYRGGHVLAVPPLLVSLCLARAGLERDFSSKTLPRAVGERILRIGAYLAARATLSQEHPSAIPGGGNDEPA
jgi:hypothetical protein